MRQTTLALFSLAATGLCETAIPMFWPGFDNDVSGAQPVASVVTANPSTTLLQLACPTGADSTECGWGNGEITYTIMSTTVYQAQLSTSTLSVSFSCAYDQKNTAMACAAAVQDEFASVAGASGGVMSDTTTFTGSEVVFQTATVTAGEEKLSASAGAAASGSASASASAPASSFTTSAKATGASATTGAHASGSGASATGSGSAPQNTGAAGRFGVEGAALLALAGAAALNAF